ncbi:MAG: hypothetical protein H6585_10100 [Flavobacteriales bacterium]|nr:hypothetical protein [Flavobacteriales bacterium]
MRNNEEIMAYEDDAEDRFDDFVDEEEDFYGEDEDDFDTGFEGLEDGYDDEYEEVEYVGAIDEDDYYDHYAKTSVGKIDPNDRTLTVVVKNTGGTDAEAILFGANEEAAQPAGVTVDVEESSHKEVREESKANPFKIQGMKMSVSDPLQFDNVLKIQRKTATGNSDSKVYQPRNATSPQNFNSGLIDDNSFEADITGQDSIRTLVKAGATLVFTFTIKARANMGNLLKGSNVAEISRAPRTTGLPQLDLIQQKKAAKKPKLVRKIVRRQPVRGGKRRALPQRGRRIGLRRRRRR